MGHLLLDSALSPSLPPTAEIEMTNTTRLLVLALVAAVVLAVDYEGMCRNVQPGLWVRDDTDCMRAHQCGFEGEITQSVKCNKSQVWSKLASACVWEWDPERDDCNGQPMVPIPSE